MTPLASPSLPIARGPRYTSSQSEVGITHSRLTPAPSDGERVANDHIPLSGQRPASSPRPKAWFIPAQGNALGSWCHSYSVAGQRPASSPRPNAAPIFQAEGLVHTSPGQRPGFIAPRLFCCRPTAASSLTPDAAPIFQAEGLFHTSPGQRPGGVIIPRLFCCRPTACLITSLMGSDGFTQTNVLYATIT